MPTDVNQAISARNQLQGTIKDIRTGQAMSVVTVKVGDKDFVSALTSEAVRDLGLKVNDRVAAIVKSTEPILIKGDETQLKLSARNTITGHVTAVKKGEAMGCVTLEAGGLHMTASITRQAIDDLQLTTGDRVTAAFKATELMLLRV